MAIARFTASVGGSSPAQREATAPRSLTSRSPALSSAKRRNNHHGCSGRRSSSPTPSRLSCRRRPKTSTGCTDRLGRLPYRNRGGRASRIARSYRHTRTGPAGLDLLDGLGPRACGQLAVALFVSRGPVTIRRPRCGGRFAWLTAGSGGPPERRGPLRADRRDQPLLVPLACGVGRPGRVRPS